MTENNFRQLLENYITGQISASEQEELFKLLDDDVHQKQLELMMKDDWDNGHYEEKENAQLAKLIEQQVLNKIQGQESKLVPFSSNRKTVWLRVSAAAAVILMVATTAIFFLRQNNRQVAVSNIKDSVVNDIPPGSNKAILTLADGRTIVLDSASNGTLAQQGGIKVIKIGAQLSYNGHNNSTEVLYNTISTPKGGMYQIELADGSKAWLNAASSLKYPNAFTGDNRTVELTGEGYFEIANNAKKPFHVKVNDMDITVLGTHFDVNSYADEVSVKTTLLEGKVLVKNPANQVILNPGQQANVNGSKIQVNNHVDTDEVIAWKNGYFSFKDADLKTVMRQLSRWYNIEVIYETDNNETFSGKIDSKLSLKDLLDGLGETVHYRIEAGNKLVILK
ncbi:FecR domain-containing protein [Chitinophagaceae bacterium 26-R-25]|nr:FecR domain-containing protein [Chitinophagaceae bacterium 26-R-25]